MWIIDPPMHRQSQGRTSRLPPVRSRPNAAMEGPWPSRITYEAYIPPQVPLGPPFSKDFVVHYTQLHRRRDNGGEPATGWIVTGPGIWEYRTRAFTMIDDLGPRNDFVCDYNLSPQIDEEIQNASYVRGIACGVRPVGPMVVWGCEIDQCQLLQGSFLHRLAYHNWVSATECYASRFYVSAVRVESYNCFIANLKALINAWLDAAGFPVELHPSPGAQFPPSSGQVPIVRDSAPV